MNPIRVMLVEDHQILRQGVAALLATVDGVEVVAQAGNTTDALQRAREGGLDIAVVDVGLGTEDGIALARRLRFVGGGLRIVMLSMYDDKATVQKAQRAGAKGYVLKGGGVDSLSEAIFAVMRDEEWLDPKLPGQGASAGRNSELPLTEREVMVLELVAAGRTSAEIADKLGLATKTVQNHRARMMEKLSIHSTAALVRYAIDNGLG